MSSATSLSQNDRAVLGALFDPEASLTNGGAIITNSLPADTIPAQTKAAEQSAIQTLNTASPSTSDINTAITTLTQIIHDHPTYASAYANRAQALRLLPKSLTTPSTTTTILTDLATAIHLSTPQNPLAPISPSDARVLSSAHTHRGYLLLRAASEPSFLTLLTTLPLQDLHLPITNTNQLTPETLEELASKDFSIAGRYGNKTAQTLAVKTNPYAKLCGQIVKEALHREIKEFYEGPTTASTMADVGVA